MLAPQMPCNTDGPFAVMCHIHTGVHIHETTQDASHWLTLHGISVTTLQAISLQVCHWQLHCQSHSSSTAMQLLFRTHYALTLLVTCCPCRLGQ